MPAAIAMEFPELPTLVAVAVVAATILDILAAQAALALSSFVMQTHMQHHHQQPAAQLLHKQVDIEYINSLRLVLLLLLQLPLKKLLVPVPVLQPVHW